MLSIKLNGKTLKTNTCSIHKLKSSLNPEADIVIYNGFALTKKSDLNAKLKNEDIVFFFSKRSKQNKKTLAALMMARNNPGTAEKLKKAVVGIAGAGGLGSNAAMALARCGIGKLIIADFDIVEPSNLNRQAYSVKQIGMPKVKALKANIAAANPFVKIIALNKKLNPKNISFFAEADILLEAFDKKDEKAMLVESFSKKFPKKPIIMASGLAGSGLSDNIKTHKIGNKFYIVGDLVSGAAPGIGLMAPRVKIAAAHQANLVLRLILGEEK